MVRTAVLAVVVVVLVVVVVSVAYLLMYAKPRGASTYPVNVTDALGRVVVINAQPGSIGIVSPDCAQIIYALGFGGRVNLIDTYSLQLLQYLNVSVPGNVTVLHSIWPAPNIDKVILAHPSLLCADAGFNYGLTKYLGQLAAANITVVFINGTNNVDLSGIESDVMLMARVLGVPQRGEAVVSGMNSVINYVKSKVSSEPRVTVVFLAWYNPIYAAGNSSFIGYYITLAGGYDPVGGMYPTITPSQLLVINPDYIIASNFMDNYTATLEAILSIPGINETNAAKEGHIYILGDLATSLVEEPGPLSVYGALELAMIMHPGAFGITEVPHFITAQWVIDNVKPSLNLTIPSG
ncbi:ABC transporter substrate-binding protein [Vulcanisaeta thermophila]|uniref:ABC transporter substrate-binding protein n=1 Tax=Vulcanisaeta thermophila TaxID=867917 RepID=UPI0008536BFE|nr:ABC transporter substrate-binding protein [Vulcanisaeta thermophila]